MQKPSILNFLIALSLTSCTGISYKTFTNGFSGVEGEINPKTRIFLVSGGYPNANFAQEIVDQKAYWLSQGYSKEQIACYYVPPPTGNFIDGRFVAIKDNEIKDHEQFNKLKRSLEDCFMATSKSLLHHIESLEKENPSSIYIYITGHGTPPLKVLNIKEEPVSPSLNDWVQVKAYKKKWKKIISLDQWSNTYTLQMGAARKKSFDTYYYNDQLGMALMFAEENPNLADDYLLTPRGLSRALNKLPNTTQKHIVLQGCFSGGFILPPQKAPGGHTLQNVQNLNVLAAARSDRTSFGCDSENQKTNFGEIYFNNLQQQKIKKFDNTDWKALHKQIKEEVLIKEKALKIDSKHFSEPQFFSNIL